MFYKDHDFSVQILCVLYGNTTTSTLEKSQRNEPPKTQETRLLGSSFRRERERESPRLVSTRMKRVRSLGIRQKTPGKCPFHKTPVPSTIVRSTSRVYLWGKERNLLNWVYKVERSIYIFLFGSKVKLIYFINVQCVENSSKYERD